MNRVRPWDKINIPPGGSYKSQQQTYHISGGTGFRPSQSYTFNKASQNFPQAGIAQQPPVKMSKAHHSAGNYITEFVQCRTRFGQNRMVLVHSQDAQCNVVEPCAKDR